MWYHYFLDKCQVCSCTDDNYNRIKNYLALLAPYDPFVKPSKYTSYDIKIYLTGLFFWLSLNVLCRYVKQQYSSNLKLQYSSTL